MILIAGLGNPGEQYKETRHNLGFMVMDKLAEFYGVQFKFDKKFNAEVAETTLTFPNQKKHVRVILAKPQTFMNNSGEALQKIVQFYKFRIENQVWVVHDDLDIEIGKLRIRLEGSSAGQKGVQSIIDHLGTNRFIRFRMGIKPPEGQSKPAEQFVLEKFRPEEKKIIKEEIEEVTREIQEGTDRGIAPISI